MHQLNQYSFSRERRRFGRQCDFTDINQCVFNISPSIKRRLNYILRNPIDRETQLSKQFAFSEVETENPEFSEHGMFHFEGGWPKEVNLNDEEATLRYRKKVEREDEWGPQVVHLIEQSIVVADQNTAVNIYDDFFLDLPPELGAGIKKDFEARPCNIFHDPVMPTRRANLVDWCPGDHNSFLVQHIGVFGKNNELENFLKSGGRVRTKTTASVIALGDSSDDPTASMHSSSGNDFFVWDLENPLKPKICLDGNEVVTRAVFCPRDDNYIAGGYENGTVCLWDAKNGGLPIDITPLEASHQEPVTAVIWVHCKSNSEFYTGSSDGSIKYWDYRDMSRPTQQVLLDPTYTDEQRRDRAQGCAVLEFEYTIPVRYIAGTDHGHIFIGNRKGSYPTDILPSNYKLFTGPIRTVERNPFFVKNFVITGDWVAKIWSEECKGFPSTFYFKKKNEILCGTWSTARCSLFITGDNKGELDFWDLLLNQREPIFTMYFSSPIVYAKFRPDGAFLSIALENGDVYLMELDEAMGQSRSADKALIAALFEREQLRCRLLESRVEEIKLKRGIGDGPRPEEEPPIEQAPEEVLDPNNPMQFLQLVERDTEFKEVIRIFKEVIFALDKKRQDRKYTMERTDFEDVFDAREMELALESEESAKGKKEAKVQDPKDKGAKKKK